MISIWRTSAVQPTHSDNAVAEKSEDAAVRTPGSSSPRTWKVSTLFQNHSILALIIGLTALFSILLPRTFPTTANLQGLALGQAVSALLALSVLLVLVVGEFDLSVGYTLGLSAVLTAKLAGESGLPVPLTVTIALLAGAFVGLASGLLVARLRVVSLIATLGVGLAVSGVTVGVSGGMTLSQNIPSVFRTFVQTEILGVGSAVWIVALIALVMYIVLTKTPFGSKVYAVGGSEQVARMVGIRVRLIKCVMFSAAGALAALAGIMQLGLAGAANPSFGANLLLPAFAATFLGATTVRPGFFNVAGTMLAVVLLAVGFSGLSLLGAPFWFQPVFQGAALVIGVVLSQSISKSGRKARAKKPA
ncbi:hypothetical protein CH259_12115 [Rhodococcus sp. 05-2254-4]|nr:hypothetical protein CH259_12115 [Rhodococcus sp. 05-2254-4]OZE40717.1 hypothetical protein CH261_27080 [Rhodococcus sp. 05-2254-3]OZE45708.1 hypothetical protein CH283_25735 [Rhodococcus sp. 05-2254-2]